VEPEDEPDSPCVEFDSSTFEPWCQKYGLIRLLEFRQAMLPIEKPPQVVHLKFLIWPSAGGGEERDREEPREDADRIRGFGARDEQRDRERKVKGKSKGKGKERVYTKQGQGRFVQDMGRTEIIADWSRGQWWRNASDEHVDVIIREQFSLTSPAISHVPVGHYVQQAGPAEVFVSGQATGLVRMPVQPRGWATVDASAVGGPKYLEPVPAALWKVVYWSGSRKGDVFVRAGASLDSEEVAVLLADSCVEQCGPMSILPDGIVRMPIMFTAGDLEASTTSRQTKKIGWVTCDATSQGGPKFFEPSSEFDVSFASAMDQHQPTDRQDRQQKSASSQHQDDDEGHGYNHADTSHQRGGSWEKSRLWRVINLENIGDERLAVVSHPEPHAPGTGKIPSEGMLVRWIKDGDLVEQVGHSKKMRGYMVMPVRVIGSANNFVRPAPTAEAPQADGWVTRRLVDKQREHDFGVWFVEVSQDDPTEPLREKRREGRNRRHREEQSHEF